MQVAISFAKILLQVTRPKTAVLGKLPGTTVYRNILQYPKAAQIPGMLIVRVDSAIYFSNSNYIKDRYVFSKFVHTPRSWLRKCGIVSSF
jgi:high affinity sulfate transporter 1